MTDTEPPATEPSGISEKPPLPLPSPEEAEVTPTWARDNKARLEEKYWGNDDKLKNARVDSDVLWHKWYGRAVVVMMIFFVLVFMSSLGVWVFHYITPLKWLSEEQLSKIQSVIFSGSLGAIVSGYMQKQMSK